MTVAAVGDGPPIVEVEGLTVTFERRGRAIRALRGVDVAIGAGEIVGLVGESGSGKSVFGLSLLGLLPSNPAPFVDGRATVCGLDMVAAGTEQRRALRRQHLGAVFQDPMTSLNPTMRIGRQVAEAAGTESEAIRLLDSVGVPQARQRLRSYPHELSGGLRQRVMIAMAVAGNPSLVVADEPTTALDVTVQAQILELLAHLRDDTGCTFVLVTHDLGVAAQVADRIVVLYAGRVAELGPAAAVLDRPAHPYTEGLLHSRLTLDARREAPLPTLPGEPPDARALPPGCPFGPRCDWHEEACDDAFPALLPAGRHPGQAACRRLEDRSAGDPEAAATAATGEWPARLSPSAGPQGFALRLSGVEKAFLLKQGLRARTRLHALRGVDLEVCEGEAVALVGESGCGKTTLLRCVAGLVSPDRGSVELGPGARPQMVFQDAGASLTPWMTVGELVGERLRAEGVGKGKRAARVAEALSLVGLPSEVVGAKAAQLSGGQRQRVALARATIVPPEVLLCDEPTSALDVSLAATVLNLLGRVRRELGMAMLFVTHDLAAARVVADRIAVMYLGRIVEIGPAAEVAGDPRHPYSKALLGAVPAAGAVRAPLQGEPASPLHPPPGCSFHPRCPVALPDCATQEIPFTSSGGRGVACVLVDGRAAPESPGDAGSPNDDMVAVGGGR